MLARAAEEVYAQLYRLKGDLLSKQLIFSAKNCCNFATV